MRQEIIISIDNNDICKLLRAIDAQTKAIKDQTAELKKLRDAYVKAHPEPVTIDWNDIDKLNGLSTMDIDDLK